MARLSARQLSLLPAQVQPLTGPEGMTTGIVHLGLGAFHRAHQAVFTQNAMDATGEAHWGICGVSQRSPAVAQVLQAQDCLYSVTQRQRGSAQASVVAAIRQALFAQGQWDQLCSLMAAPSTCVLTLTVSEKGYRMHPTTRRLLADDPDVGADALGRPPVSVVGQLARGLQARARGQGPPLTVLCCDNMPANGATLSQLVNDFCALLPGREGDALGSWVSANVTFPSSVVDRIVPAATQQDREEAAQLIGAEDEAAVVTEPFCQWVIQARFASPRPSWERAGASLVPDVGPYEQMKLRLLNGSHSALAYLGALCGHDLISDVSAAPSFEAYTALLMDTDMTPTLDVPTGFDLSGYKRSLRDRFANPALRHRTSQVAMDGTQKLPYRLVAPANARLAAGQLPRYIALAIAAWMRYVSAGHDDQGRPLTIDDPLAERLRTAAGGASSGAQLVGSLLGLAEVFPPQVSGHEAFRQLLVQDVTDLERFGAAAVVASATR